MSAAAPVPARDLPQRADQRVIHDAELPARLPVRLKIESGEPVFAVIGGGAKRRIGDSRSVKAIDLLVAA